MKNKYKYLLKNIGILTISNFSSKVLVFLLLPLYTACLTTVEYGTYDLIVTTVTLVFPILTCNIMDAVMRFSLDKDSENDKIFSVALKFVSASIIFVGACLFLNSKFKLITQVNDFELLIFLYYTFTVLNNLLLQFAKGIKKITIIGISGLFNTIATVCLNIYLLYILDWGLKGFLVASIVGLGISVIFFAISLKIWKYVTFGIYKLLTKDMVVYSLPLIFTTIGWWINNSADKYVVSLLCGVSATGLISVAYKIPAIIQTIQDVFLQAWHISAITEYGKKESNEFYKTIYVYLNAFLCVVCSLFILLIKPISSLLFSNEFFEAWQYVPFLLVSSVINASSGFIGPILSAKKDTKTMGKAAVIGSVVNVFLNVIFVSFIGIQGATIATLISSVVIYMVRKKEIGNILYSPKYKKIVLSWLLICVQAICMCYFSSVILNLLLFITIITLYASDIVFAMKYLKGCKK